MNSVVVNINYDEISDMIGNIVNFLSPAGDRPTVEMFKADESREVTVCRLCSQQFSDPRTLPCLHTFCLQCLINRQPSSTADDSASVRCPLCDGQYAGPLVGLPRNLFVEKLIRIKQVSDAQQKPCDVCLQDDSSSLPLPGSATTGLSSSSSVAMASHYCLDCAESLCDSCCSMHSRIRSSRRHRVVRRGTQLSAQDLRAGPAAHCDQHADEPLKMFCCDCARCICFLCYAEHHTGHRCQDVNKVGDKYSSDLDRIVERASAVLAEETDDGAQADKRRDQFVALLRQHEAAVQQQAGQLKLLVDLHAGELIQTLADIRNVALDKFADVKNGMQQCYRLTDDFRRYAVEVRQRGSVSDVVDMVSALEGRVGQLEQQHGLHHNSPHLFDDVSLVPADLQQVLAKHNITNLVGHIYRASSQLSCAPAAASKDRDHRGIIPAVKPAAAVKKMNLNKGRRTFQLSAKGSLVVRDCTDDGKCLTVENTGTKKQYLGGWRVVRNIDGEDVVKYAIPHDLQVESRTKVKLWCTGCKPAGDSATDYETSLKTWGVGANVVTRLFSPAGMEQATHHQKTIHA